MSDLLPDSLSGGRVESRELDQEMRSSFLDYAMSVIVSRALPDVRDGLKPVHRRVLYAMHEAGLQPNRPRLKCARVVGDVDDYPAAAMRYCLVGETRISTAEGTIRLDSLVPEAQPESDNELDLEALDRLGEPVRASKLFHSGEHPTLRVRTVEGYEVTGTVNHPVLCLVDVLGVPMLLWKLLDEIRPGDRVAIARRSREWGQPVADDQRRLALL